MRASAALPTLQAPPRAPDVGLTLQLGALRCVLRPELGGCIAGLWYQGLPLLRSTEASALASVRQSACYPLLPYANRIGHGHFEWLGQSYALRPNFAPEPHAIHGLGWQRAWQVRRHSEHDAELGLRHTGDADWPFAFEAVQHITLHANRLRLALSLRNLAPHNAPLGLGWHPYFSKHPSSQAALSVDARWEMGADKLPTQRVAQKALNGACRDWHFDHCLEGWDGVATLDCDAWQAWQLRLRSNLRRLVLFTDPARDFIAIEPVSHVNNALQLAHQPGLGALDLGLASVPPGASIAAWMEIEVAG